MLLKYFYSLIIILGIISSTYAGFITNGLSKLGLSLTGFIGNANVLAVLYFFALLLGMYALFNALFKFIFKDHALNGENKVRKVLSFMFSFIGVSGIYFMFRNGNVNGTTQFVLTLGGFFGLIIIMILSFFIFKLFQNFAENLTKDAKKGATAGYVTMMALATLLIGYLVFGYTGQVLEQYNCTPTYETIVEHAEEGLLKEDLCVTSIFFGTLIYWIVILIELALAIAIIFGIWFGVQKFKKDEGGEEDEKDNSKSKEKKSRIKKVEGALNSVMKSAKNIENLTKDESDLIKQMGEYTETFEKGSRRVPGQEVSSDEGSN